MSDVKDHCCQWVATALARGAPDIAADICLKLPLESFLIFVGAKLQPFIVIVLLGACCQATGSRNNVKVIVALPKVLRWGLK